MPKHFNLGIVRGKVLAKKIKPSKGKSDFLQLKIQCDHPTWGEVVVWGRLWGKEAILSLIEQLNRKPREVYKFTGFFGQYLDDKQKLKNNYSFHKWDNYSKPPGATFLLTCLLESKQVINEDGSLNVLLNRQGLYDKIEERFTVTCPPGGMYKELSPGQTLELAGTLITEGEDPYGRQSQIIIPLVEEIKKK